MSPEEGGNFNLQEVTSILLLIYAMFRGGNVKKHIFISHLVLPMSLYFLSPIVLFLMLKQRSFTLPLSFYPTICVWGPIYYSSRGILKRFPLYPVDSNFLALSQWSSSYWTHLYWLTISIFEHMPRSETSQVHM